jgi:aminopeptidase
MISQRELQKVARKIIRTNLAIKEKDLVTISAGPNSLDFAEALAYEIMMVGGQTSISYGSDRLSLRIYKDINSKFLKNKPKLAPILSRKVDVAITIDDSNPFIAKKLPQKKIEIRRKVLRPFRKIEEQRQLKKDMRAALIGFPTLEDSKAMKIPFKKLSRIFWDTMIADYEGLYRFNKKLLQKLSNADKVKIIGERTNLEFSVKNRRFFNACGLVSKKGEMGYLNLPDGEIFTAPVETSVNGEIYFDLPCMYHYGKQVEGIWFKFKNGILVDYKVEKGLKDFEDIYKNASGNKNRIGELGIGTNPKAKVTGGMIIVDEKVRGTIHMAIGSNKHFGGKNDATIHWDFFKSMRRNGTRIFVDGKIFMKDGKFV